ncbi:MAG: MFS transporter [Firmicutes bacterium]|nr:MFS transporter [Bacillota bacterium]
MEEKTTTLDRASMQRAMRICVIDGIFASASENMIGPFLALFALALGATKGQVGLLAALPALVSNSMQIPAARLTERLGDRKRLVVITSVISRFFILAIATVPLMLQGDVAIYTFIGLVTLRGLFANLGVPGWTSIMADITPRDSRGSYFASRNMLCNMAALSGTLVAGWLVRTYDFPAGYRISFLLAVGLGLTANYFYSTLPIPPMPRRPATRQPLVGLKSWRETIARHTAFRNYCFTSVLWNFGVSFVGPLFPVYYRQDLGGDPGFWGVVTATGVIATLIGQRYWGRLADQYGQKNVMLVGGIGAASVPLFWWFVPRWQLAPVAQFLGSFCWGGYNLAAFNLILEITPDEGRTTFVGVYNTMAGLASSMGPLVGGYLADIYGLRVVIAISGVLRWLGYFAFRSKVPSASDAKLHWSDLVPFRQDVRISQRLREREITKKDSDLSD